MAAAAAPALVAALVWRLRSGGAIIDAPSWVLLTTLCLLTVPWGMAVLVAGFRRTLAGPGAIDGGNKSGQTDRDHAQSVDHLLEFSQVIRGAGAAEQVYEALGQFLRSELGLAAVAVLTYDRFALPAIQIKAQLPANLMPPDRTPAEMNAAHCPCLRQSLQKEFCPTGSPVRCSVDQYFAQGSDHAGYCIPMTIGPDLRGAAHMLLPPGQEWNRQRRQLAEAYVNTAVSVLGSLRLLAEAEKQSTTDSLTGLYNRRSMEQLVRREVALAERHGHALSVVMIDVDRFKEINDLHGHIAGDHMLKGFGDCVRIALRKTDLAFRYGGDEFLVALPQTSLAQAQQVVEKLRQAFGTFDFSHVMAGLDHQPTLSVGVVQRSAKDGVVTLDQLLGAADHALYEAKAGRRVGAGGPARAAA